MECIIILELNPTKTDQKSEPMLFMANQTCTVKMSWWSCDFPLCNWLIQKVLLIQTNFYVEHPANFMSFEVASLSFSL